MAVPVPGPRSDEWHWLGRARTGEGNRPWSAGAGAGALATGVAQTAWILSRLHTLAPRAIATTQSQRFTAGEANLLLTEAFVSGTGKPVPVVAGQHIADAEAAARATLTYLAEGPEGFPLAACAPDVLSTSLSRSQNGLACPCDLTRSTSTCWSFARNQPPRICCESGLAASFHRVER